VTSEPNRKTKCSSVVLAELLSLLVLEDVLPVVEDALSVEPQPVVLDPPL
jgi:hypothetical protein